MEVDGVDVSHAPLSDVTSRVLGPAGTEVTLTILREGETDLREVTITRAKIVVRNVTWQMLPGTDVAHVRITGFSNNVADDLVRALKEAQGQGAKGILLDLRNNPGGFLNEAIGVVSQFLKPGNNVMQTKDAQGNVENIAVERGGVATEIPLVVLINEGSASAAEITAGAMQDYERATLVGKKTFGTGTVLNQFRLQDGSALLLATQLWLTPNGRVIWHQGIAPDVEVDLPAEISPSFPEGERELTEQGLRDLKDTQLKKALEVVMEKIR
jgi:carboxyl-terminal processing protease